MASTKQITANRANALRSSGPKTAVGKKRSSLNAVKHGLSAKGRILDGENAAEFELLQQELITEFEPANTLETHLVAEIGMGFWQLRRAAQVEALAICARRAECKPEELETPEERARRVDAERRKRTAETYRDKRVAAQGIAPANPALPSSDGEPVENPDELFLRQVGVMFSKEASLSDFLLRLDRYETTQLNGIAQKLRLLSVLRGDRLALRRAAGARNS